MQRCMLISIVFLTVHQFAMADGVLEINQTCALNSGCFSGDTAGFPVSISGAAGRSYRLTGDLDLSGVPDTTAIDIDAPYITLDLNGFEIAGPITCTGSGPTLNCGAVGSGDGVSLSGNADFVTIKNGTIRNMSRHGVGASGNELRITDVTARHNARDGLNGGTNSLAINCIAHENGNDGFQFGSGSVIKGSVGFGNGTDGIRIEASNGVIQDSTARNNGESGFVMGHSSRFGKNSSTGNALPDECGGGICSELRRYYLTQDSNFDGLTAPTACVDGFHFASVFEIIDTSNLAYDVVLGYMSEDIGSGPTSVTSGWIKTGGGDGGPGGGTCQAYTTNSDLNVGKTARLPLPAALDSAPQGVSPFQIASPSCDNQRGVWCVED